VEDQTSASPEELETPSNAPSAGDESGAEAAPEGGAKSGRTLKLKASEASNEASADEAAEPPAEASSDKPSPDADSNSEDGAPQGRSRRGRQRRPRRDPNTPSANPMSLTELKNKSTQELIDMAREMGIENMARSRKQDIIFSLLKRHAKSGEDIWGDGVLEILQDGFGFLRSADSSFLAGPDDIYVSPSQIRRFNLRTGDTVTG